MRIDPCTQKSVIGVFVAMDCDATFSLSLAAKKNAQ